MKQNSNQTTERWGIRYTGIVQGVGFRPLVSMLAHSLGLTGFVYNDSQGVYVEVLILRLVMIALKSYNKINVERNILSSIVQIADQGIR